MTLQALMMISSSAMTKSLFTHMLVKFMAPIPVWLKEQTPLPMALSYLLRNISFITNLTTRKFEIPAANLCFPAKYPDADKIKYGRTLVIAGSKNIYGAAFFAVHRRTDGQF